MDDVVWLIWSTLLAISCWSMIARVKNNIPITILCMLASSLAIPIARFIREKNTAEIVAIPPYHFFTFVNESDCITLVTQKHATSISPNWHYWINALTCEPTCIILTQQELWRESHAIKIMKNRRLRTIFSPKKTLSTSNCESITRTYPTFQCQVINQHCECKLNTPNAHVHIKHDKLEIIATQPSSYTQTSIPEAWPRKITIP